MNLVDPTIIVEPQELFREGIHRILLDAQFRVFWSYDVPPKGPIDGLSAEQSPLVIVGSRTQDIAGHVSQIKREFPKARIVLMIEPEWQEEILTALQRGVSIFITRNCSSSTFISTLKLALEGAAVLPHWVLPSVVSGSQEPIQGDEGGGPITWVERGTGNAESVVAPPSDALSANPRLLGSSDFSLREVGVLKCLREGRSNKEIARNLGISESTVKAHVKAILRKGRVRNRTQAAMWSSTFSMEQFGPTAAPKLAN